MNLPDYDALPQTEGGARSGWKLFGEDDSLGLMNLQTPERVLAAAKLVRKGAVFSLNAPLDYPSPPLYGRGAVRRTNLSARGGRGFDDVLDNFYPQAASQWDSLGHVGFKDDTFYNGVNWEDVDSGRRNTIEHWARKGIAGRCPCCWTCSAPWPRPADPSTPAPATRSASTTWRRRASGPAWSSSRATWCWCAPASPPGTWSRTR
jgi:hypothetical protein